MRNQFDLFPNLVSLSVALPHYECVLSAHHRCTSEESPFELIHGDEFIYESYNGKKFRISPESFLQVNKKSAELVYSTALKHAQIDNNTILLDIGSGIGKGHLRYLAEIICIYS